MGTATSTSGGSAIGFGVDIGGSGIKGSIVDLDAGQLAQERVRIDTPHPSTPQLVAEVVADVVGRFHWSRPIGVTLPSVVKSGVAQTAANIDPSWIGTDAAALFSQALGGQQAIVLNDADAAGMAEMRYGAGMGQAGVVLLLTFGTGIGSALFVDGVLVPNTELGHIEVAGHDGEDIAAASVRDESGSVLEALGPPGQQLPPGHRTGALAGPDHRRRWGQPEGRPVAAPAGAAHARGARRAAQRRRDRRRRDGGRSGRARVAGGAGLTGLAGRGAATRHPFQRQRPRDVAIPARYNGRSVLGIALARVLHKADEWCQDVV